MSLIIRRVSIETYSHIGDCHYPRLRCRQPDNRQSLRAIKPGDTRERAASVIAQH